MASGPAHRNVTGPIRRVSAAASPSRFFRRNPSVPLKRVVIGLGAQKSATSWLASALALHEDIHIHRKEVHYWDVIRYPYTRWDGVHRIVTAARKEPDCPFGEDPLDHSRYIHSLEFGRTKQQIVGDFTPAYALCKPSTFAEMKRIHDDVRFVFLMRDPVDRLWSGIRHRLRRVLERKSDFDVERLFLEACNNPCDPDLLRSRYDLTLEALGKAGCKTCFLFYETLFTEGSMRALSEFIGVDHFPADFDQRKNVGAGKGIVLSAAARNRARETLGKTYEYLEDRFGELVPSTWTPEVKSSSPHFPDAERIL